MLVLNRAEIEALLDLDLLIDALATTMADLSAGRASVPPRIAAQVPSSGGLLAAMPGYVPSSGVLMSKLVTLFPGNEGTALPTHQAVIAMFDPRNGRPTALLDGTAITAIRTGAGSALSARLLAREDATVLAVLGTGVQARSHVRALLRVRPIREIRIAGRDPARAAALAAELAATTDAAVRAVPSYREALDGTDIACATTHAAEPVVRREWLAPGVHVTSVGINRTGREIDAATIADALVVVESREVALAAFPAGSNDLLMAIRDGAITAAHVHTEIGELVTGARSGRQSTEDITLYKSVGVAAQDAAAAALVVAAAQAQGIGAQIALE
jgi:ornithine cyclodeaminase